MPRRRERPSTSPRYIEKALKLRMDENAIIGEAVRQAVEAQAMEWNRKRGIYGEIRKLVKDILVKRGMTVLFAVPYMAFASEYYSQVHTEKRPVADAIKAKWVAMGCDAGIVEDIASGLAGLVVP